MKIDWRDWLPFRLWRIVAEFESVNEIPDKLPRNGIALVPKPGGLKWIVFDCPCRSGHRIMLNADHARKPFWHLEKSKPPTIFPSIDFQDNARHCHYFIRNGRVFWARDNNR